MVIANKFPCKGGSMRLCVPCGCKSGRRGRNCFDYHVSEIRPLTDEEVKEVVVSFDDYINQVETSRTDILLHFAEQDKLTFNNQPVTLEPMEG